jgi:uncharacterized protein YukE
MGNTRVDAAALCDAGQQFAAAADILETAARRMVLVFTGSVAGRAHGVSGERLHDALTQLYAGLREWARAADEIATGLRSGAEYYSEAEDRAAAVLG